MEDLKQNQQIEARAAQAATGKPYRWQDIPISETGAARRTDPFRLHGLFVPRERGKDGRSFALDAAYFSIGKLNDAIEVTPEGFLICKNVCVGRTGFQSYRVAEVTDPERLLRDYDDDEIDLWRDPAEVFSRAALASFEGKSITLNHPGDLLTSESDRDYAIGHIQNVRQGSEVLDSGDWPLVADLIIKDKDAIDSLLDGTCEVSCGYSYRLAREGSRWDQRDIRGNHIALVSKGRAGSEARIEIGAKARG